MQTSADYSPWSLLPAPDPRNTNYKVDYFYDNVAKHLVKDTVRIMSNGLGIDLDKVTVMSDEITAILVEVRATLAANPIVRKFQQQRYSRLTAEYIAERQSHCREPSYFARPFKHNDQTHRSYFMHIFAQQQGIAQPSDLLPTGIAKWPATLVKKLSPSYPVLLRLLDGSLPQSHATIVAAMSLYCEHRAELHNRQYLQQIADLAFDMPDFSPRSPDQKHALLTGLLGWESNALTDAYEKYQRELDRAQRYGKALPTAPKLKFKWGRPNLELILKSLTDPDEIELVQALIDFSFGDKILTSFVPAFYEYTINGRLYSNLRLLGAKSGRYTSSEPNMLQLPSQGRYAKTVKKCFIAAEDYVILTADFNALEDRVLASITLDEGKCAILEQGLDGHAYNSLTYYEAEVRKFIPNEGTYNDQVRKFAAMVDAEHSELKKIRQRSKAVTFKLAYNGMSDSHKGGAITPEIYDNYHNTLYPGVRSYIDDYVLPTATANGKLHLGLGFYIKSDKPDRDVRTLHNATIQFWSILTAITINELHRRIDEANLQNDIKVIATIYDSIYLEVRSTPSIIKWANDNLIECMTKDFMVNQRIPNCAESDIGRNWADLHRIPNGASLEQINDVLSNL